jgi:hypothetical protein
MTVRPEQLNRLMQLCGAVRDGVITPEQFAELNEMLEQFPWARAYYLDYAYLCTDLCHFQSAARPDPCGFDISADSAVTLEMLRILGEYEKTAEAIELPPAEQSLPITKATVEKIPHPVSKLSLVTFFTSLAALLLMVTYVVLNPRTSYEVATLTDSLGAQWTLPFLPQKGLRLTVSSEPVELQRGILKITSDKGVHIMLEAPAEFNFTGPDEILLHHGRLFASVSQGGTGFTVHTDNARIIDLGTRFGVYADLKGETELHMFKGKALLIAGQSQFPRKATEVSAGRALRVDYTGQVVKDIPLRGDVFAHDLDSHTGLLWRGQTEIDLADVLGGGSGFGTGQPDVGVNPATGVVGKAVNATRRQANTFVTVTSNRFIDGVFVPNGKTEQIISSAGHRFVQCPVTSGYFFADIVNTPAAVSLADGQTQFPLVLGEVNYSLPENPSILLHANAGITFDLSRFRAHLPDAKITRFQSQIGISETAPKSREAEFWVLVDGQVRYHNTTLMRPGESATISVPLKETDRFLTLVTTDGGVYDEIEDRHGIGYDWCVFGRPVLIVE